MKSLNTKIHLILIFFTILSSLYLMNCQSKENVVVDIYTKPPEEKLDSLEYWFSDYKNYQNKDFLTKFYFHFNQRIAAQQWEKASQLLRWTGYNLVLNEKTDSLLIQTSIEFLDKYGNNISNDNKSGVYHNIGELFYYDSNFQLAKFYLQKSINTPPTDYYTLLNISESYKTLSYLYIELSQFDKALEANRKALEIATKLKDNNGIGGIYDALGNIYLSLDDFENANKCFENAIKYLGLSGDINGIFVSYNNKVTLYQSLRNEELLPAIDTFYRFYQTNKIDNVSYGIYARSWYSYKLLKENKIAQAEQLLKEILPDFEHSNEKFLYTAFLSAISLHNQKTGNPLISKEVFFEVIDYYKKYKNFTILASCYDFLKEDALRKKDFKTAFFYNQEYEAVNDSLYNRTLVLKTKELDKKYQTQKKEQQIVLQKKEIEQKNTSIALLVTLLAGLFFLTVAFNLWQKQKILKQDKANSMNFTKQLLANTEEERKRIASDLHDSISHELLNLKSIFKQDLTTVNTKIDTIINDIRGISRNLHPVMFDKIGLEPNIEQLVERIQQQNDFMVSTEINYKGSLSSADELQIYRIIQEALTNIIKYAKAHAGKITITQHDEHLFVEIKDNGIGFNVKETLNSGKSFGLHNIIERSRVIGGKADISSSPKGTFIRITIPQNS